MAVMRSTVILLQCLFRFRKKLNSIQFSSCSLSVSLFFPTPVNHTPPQVLDIQNCMPRPNHTQPSKFIVKLFTVLNTLWFKHNNHQKAESSIAASIRWHGQQQYKGQSSIQSLLNSLQNSKWCFIFTTSVIFQLPIILLLVQKVIHTISLTLPASIPQQFLTYLFLRTTTTTIYIKISLPQPFSQYRLHQETRESFEDWYCLISLFFLKVWIVLTVDSQRLILYRSCSETWCIAGSSIWCRYLQLEWQITQSTISYTLNLLPLLPYPTNTITRTHISLETISLTSFSSKFSISIYYSYPSPPLHMFRNNSLLAMEFKVPSTRK